MNALVSALAAYAALTPEQIVALVVFACLAFSAFVIRLLSKAGGGQGGGAQ
jgi:hypothetical protein